MRCLIDTFENAQNFIVAANQCEGEIDVKQGRYVVDGKSIIGVMSLNLAAPVEITCTKPEEESLFEQYEYTE